MPQTWRFIGLVVWRKRLVRNLGEQISRALAVRTTPGVVAGFGSCAMAAREKPQRISQRIRLLGYWLRSPRPKHLRCLSVLRPELELRSHCPQPTISGQFQSTPARSGRRPRPQSARYRQCFNPRPRAAGDHAAPAPPAKWPSFNPRPRAAGDNGL